MKEIKVLDRFDNLVEVEVTERDDKNIATYQMVLTDKEFNIIKKYSDKNKVIIKDN